MNILIMDSAIKYNPETTGTGKKHGNIQRV